MCGIAGYVIRKNSTAHLDQASLVKMTDVLEHRGPDDQGYYWSHHVGLGSRRLSIIDLSPAGRMPIWNETGTIAVVQNGEIYNYGQLKKELLSKGHHFIGDSDTEVIVHLYEEIGVNCFEKFDGMFAISIWDSQKKQLILARDRFGEKPLYYYLQDGKLAFASELKSLVLCPFFEMKINWPALDQFLSLGYILSPNTPYIDASKLQPGQYLIYDQEKGDIKINQYWSLPDPSAHEITSEDDSLAKFEDLFLKSVESRMVSDVPVGAFLSGGIDSSLVVAAMVRMNKESVQTFSIGFESSEEYNENYVAREVANSLGVEHSPLSVSFYDVMEIIDKLPWLWDEPIGDPALMAAYLITRKARNCGFKVMLTGDGGDELFLGYPVYGWMAQLNAFYKLPRMIRISSAKGIQIISRLLQNSRLDKGAHALKSPDLLLAAYYLTGYGAWPLEATPTLIHDMKFNLLESSFAKAFNFPLVNPDPMYSMSNSLAFTFLPDNNQARMDRVSMANSVETRAPFLNPSIATFAAQLPLTMKIRGSNTKYLLRKSLSNYVQSDVVYRPKHGFNALPMATWLRSDLNFLVQNYLNPIRLKKQGIFEPEIVETTVKQHMMGRKYNHWWKLWLLIVVQMWLEYWANIT